jgi:membrane-bound lytic murein transglycosylase A
VNRLGYILLATFVVLIAVVSWLYWPKLSPTTGPLRLTPVAFSGLPDWSTSDARGALAAFHRSCRALIALPATHAMGGAGYAGTVGDWQGVCSAAPTGQVSQDAARNFFESWFAPVAIGAGDAGDGLFTGYYEPELRASRFKSAIYKTPIYGLPDNLVSVDLGRFRSSLRGEHVAGRIEGQTLVPYETREEIDASGLSRASILLYGDDPVAVFFLQIQGSGRVRLPDGIYLRLAFAGTNGQPYTAIGRVLIQEGALDRQNVSLQSIRAWLLAHPEDEKRILEADKSFVFFREAPLGDPSLGSTGSEGVALTPGASLAVDPQLHALGAPYFVSASSPDVDATKPDHALSRLFIAQDTGGAIKGAVRGDIYWGFGKDAEEIAGRMKSPGRLFVLLPKKLAAALAPHTDFPGASQ